MMTSAPVHPAPDTAPCPAELFGGFATADIPREGDKTYCVYNCESEALIHEHAERSGFPANAITEIKNHIDPSTADN